MDRALNPYAPGAGRLPAALAGRQEELDMWQAALRRYGRQRDAQSMVLYGLRGVGKTVLLTTFARMADGVGWFVAQVEASRGTPLRQLVGEAFQQPLARIARPGAGARLLQAIKTAVSFKASYDPTGTWTFGLDLSDSPGGGADSGILEADLTRLLGDMCDAAAHQRVGVALLIDEAQDLERDELAILCRVIHHANQQALPLMIVLAGLPSLPGMLADAKSYAERLFAYRQVGALTWQQASDALLNPCADENVEWTPEAADVVLSAADGYPYFLQQFGNDTWNASARSPIQPDDARAGLVIGRAALDAGFFRSRWDRATPSERDYLFSMAEDGDAGSATSDVASRLGKKLSTTGPVRANLISKGLIFAPEHGRVAFTVPAMARFVDRQAAA